MTTLIPDPRVKDVKVTATMLTVELLDGRVLSVPVQWYPRLARGSLKQRNQWELCAAGGGIHWPDLDEDLSTEGLLAGRPSPEFRRKLSKAKPVAKKTEKLKATA